MFSRVHQKLGTAGFIIAIVALVAAMSGGAYAASKGLSGKEKKEVQKIAQKEAKKVAKKGSAGPKGDTGAAGATGAKGPAGPTGAAGNAGSNGSNGTNGAPGANGKSVAVTEIEPGEEECGGLGGAMVEVEGSGSGQEVCNGETGFSETLPSGKTETGAWATSPIGSGVGYTGEFIMPISFNIPLASEVPSNQVHFLKEGESNQPGCPGSAAEPSATAGNLCVYTTAALEILEGEPATISAPAILKANALAAGASAEGAVLQVTLPESSFAYGSWAVTAAE
jgi:hypothetical protein